MVSSPHPRAKQPADVEWRKKKKNEKKKKNVPTMLINYNSLVWRGLRLIIQKFINKMPG